MFVRSVLLLGLTAGLLVLVGCASASKYADYGYESEANYGPTTTDVAVVQRQSAAPPGEGAFGFGGADEAPAAIDALRPAFKKTDKLAEKDSNIADPQGGKDGEGGEQGGQNEPPPDKGQIDPPKERMIIYNGQIGLLVFKIDEKLGEARALGKKHGGWIQQSTSNSLIMRVPAKNFDKLMAELEKLGDVNFKNITGTDVTEEFFDLQIRLKNAMVLRDRFIQLLAQAKTVEASLAIEKELARLTEQIERMKGRLRFLRDHAAFSTITITLQPKQAVAQPGRIPLPFGWLRDYSLDSVVR